MSSFLVPTKDLKHYESISLKVTSNIYPSEELLGNPIYKVVLPDFMFKELADSELQFATKHDWNNKATVSGLFSDKALTHTFKKTQTSQLMSALQDYFSELTTIINERHSFEKTTAKKKIFISFHHQKRHSTNNLNGAYRGEITAQQFQYFTGYEMMSTKFDSLNPEPQKTYITKIRYHSPQSTTRHLDTGFKEQDDLVIQLNSVNQSNEAFEDDYSIIDWTEEREDFCKKIQEMFDRVNADLSNFLNDIDSEKMDMLMSSNALKFLTK